MNKKLIVVVVLVVLLILGGWYYLSSNKQKSGGAPGVSQSNTEKSSSSSLRDLISGGVAQSCTYSTDSSSGTVYVSGGKVRGDFDVKTESLTTKSHMIIMDNTSYIWSDGQNTGIKMSFDPNTPTTPTTNNGREERSGLDPTANYRYKCSAWIADPSQFTLPAGVTFGTFAMPSANSPGSTNNNAGTTANPPSGKSQCSYCDALTGEDKTQCLKAFNCN